MKYRYHKLRDKGFVQVNGKRIYLPGKYNSRESLRAYAEIAGDKAKASEPKAPATIAGLAVKYLDHCEIYYPNPKRGQYKNVRACLRRLLKDYRDTRVSDFGPRKLKDFMVSLTKDGCSRQYANKCCSLIKRMFKWAVSEEIVQPEILVAINSTMPLRAGQGRDTDPKKPVAWRDVRVTIRSAHPMLAAMIKIQWLVGCRPGEVCTLRVFDIDRSKPIWEWAPTLHKNAWRGRTLSYFLGH